MSRGTRICERLYLVFEPMALFRLDFCHLRKAIALGHDALVVGLPSSSLRLHSNYDTVLFVASV